MRLFFCFLLVLSNAVFAKDLELKKELQKQTADNPALTVPPGHPIGTEKEKRDWLKQLGTPLKPDDIETIRSMIKNSNCEFYDWSSQETVPAQKEIVMKPSCQGSAPEKGLLCRGNIRCENPLMDFFVGAICWSKDGKTCPSAADCAVGSPLNVRTFDSNTGTYSYVDQWIGGHVDYKK